MNRSYTAPDDFEVTLDRLEWAMTEFNISKAEVMRQTEIWHDYEFRRAYFDWGRVWKRWFRKCDELNQFRRERKPRLVEEVSDEQRQADILAFERDPLIRKALNK